MKIGIMIWGAFLIIGSIADQAVMPGMLSSVNNLTDSIQGNIMSALPENIQTSSSITATSADLNSGFDHMRLQLISLGQYIQMISISMGLVGVGLVTFGGLAKNNTKFKINDTAIEILKKRLAKGEITKMEFDNLKHDIQ